MLERLPTELQEQICSLLDGESLLKASCVSSQWNRIIASLQTVWRAKCMRNGFGCLAVDWKEQYLACHRLLQDVKNGSAFQHKNFAPKCFHFCDVRDVAVSHGYLFAGIHTDIRVWRESDLKLMLTFQAPHEVFRLSLSEDGHVLAVGHYGGLITSWLLDMTQQQLKANKLQVYIRHSDNVVCLCVCPESDLLCTGSRDRTVKLWKLGSGDMLAALPASGWVAQVTLVSGINPSFLIMDQTCVRLCTWWGDIASMQVHQLHIPVDKKVSMRRLIVQGKNVMFVRNCSVVVMCLDTLTEMRSIAIDCRDLVLLACGSRYMLATLWESCQKNSRLAVIDLSTGDIIGSYPIPFCREYVVVGDTEWLDELPQRRSQQLVAVGWMMGVLHMNQLTDMLYLIKWT